MDCSLLFCKMHLSIYLIPCAAAINWTCRSTTIDILKSVIVVFLAHTLHMCPAMCMYVHVCICCCICYYIYYDIVHLPKTILAQCLLLHSIPSFLDPSYSFLLFFLLPILPSFLGLSFHSSSLHYFLPSSFLLSIPPPFIPSFLPSSINSFLPLSVLPSLQPSFLHTCMSTCFEVQ